MVVPQGTPLPLKWDIPQPEGVPQGMGWVTEELPQGGPHTVELVCCCGYADRSDQISAMELQRALLNGNWSQFNP